MVALTLNLSDTFNAAPPYPAPAGRRRLGPASDSNKRERKVANLRSLERTTVPCGSGSPVETRAGQACVTALRAIATAAPAAHVLVHVTNRCSASLANGNRGFMAERATACFRSGERHSAPALGLHNQTHGHSTFLFRAAPCKTEADSSCCCADLSIRYFR